MASSSIGRPRSLKDEIARSSHRRRFRWKMIGAFLLTLVLLASIGRALLPWAVRNYVNQTLDRSPMYAGTIGKITIHLWHGAYSIHDVRVAKTTGNIPVPLFAARQVDFAMEWRALLHRRVVGQVVMKQPELNFVDAPGEGEAQTGAGGPWLQIIGDLFPFKINSALIHDGLIHFRAYQTPKPVDVYLSHVEATISNLGNIRDETRPLVSTVEATALAMDQAKLEYKMTLDPFSYRPTFHLAVRLLGLDVTNLNDLALAYGKFNFKRGWFDLVVETDSKEGQISGYVKPLFRSLKVFSLSEDIKEDDVLHFFWQALVGMATSVLNNSSRDQFGTLIPFTGQAAGATTVDVLATLGNVLRNAFIRAYLPRLENGQTEVDGLQFQPPEIQEAVSDSEPP